jgi:hypothetical protein
MNYKLTTFLLIAGMVSTIYCINHNLLEQFNKSRIGKKASETICCIQYSLHYHKLLKNPEVSTESVENSELQFRFKNSTDQNCGSDHSAGSCS